MKAAELARLIGATEDAVQAALDAFVEDGLARATAEDLVLAIGHSKLNRPVDDVLRAMAGNDPGPNTRQ